MAVKFIKLPSTQTEELLVDTNTEIINMIKMYNWSNVIKIYDMWYDENIAISTRLCILMDWGACSLHILLKRGFRYEGPPWFDIMRGMVLGLTQAHMNGITHGDLKPSNSYFTNHKKTNETSSGQGDP